MLILISRLFVICLILECPINCFVMHTFKKPVLPEFGLVNPNRVVHCEPHTLGESLSDFFYTPDPDGDVDAPPVLVWRPTRDIATLFYVKRLERLGLGADRFLSSLQSQPSYDTSGISDADLTSFVKSRHIQSASEMLAWSQHLDKSYTDLAKSVVESERVKRLNKEFDKKGDNTTDK